MKTEMLHKFITAEGKAIMIPATFNLRTATEYARREDKAAKYVGIEIKW